MLRRSLAGLVFTLAICGIVMAEETAGSITKIEDGSLTIRVGGGFGGKGGKGGKGEAKETTVKFSKDIKIVRTGGKDKEEVKLTIDELKTAIKVTNVFATVVHDGDNATEIKVGLGGFGGLGGKGGKTKDKDKKKDDKNDK